MMWLLRPPPPGLALAQKTKPTSIVLGPVLCHHALAQKHFRDRKGLKCLDMTACHNVDIEGLGILGEQTTTQHMFIYKLLLQRRKAFVTSQNDSHLRNLQQPSHERQKEFIKGCILCSKLKMASG